MNHFTPPILSAAMILMIVGCDPQTSAPAEPTQDAPPNKTTVTSDDKPDANTPKQTPAPNQDLIRINGADHVFPKPILSVKERRGRVIVQLFSDDPREALNRDYSGNSYYFDLILQVPTVDEIPTQVWSYKAPSSEPIESFQGFFIKGSSIHALPQDVQMHFAREGDFMRVDISGTFLWIDKTAPDGAVAPRVTIVESLRAEIRVR